MEATMRAEILSPPMVSNEQGDMEGNANGAEYTVLPPSGVYPDMNSKGGDFSHFGAIAFQSLDSSKERNQVGNEGAFRYCSFAPSQAFTRNCGSPFFGSDSNKNDCPTTSSEADIQNYAVDSSCRTPKQAAFQYSSLGNTGNYVNSDRNTAGMAGFEPQVRKAASSSVDSHAYEGYHNGNPNAEQFYSNPSYDMNFHDFNAYPFPNMEGFEQDPVQGQSYGCNCPFSNRKGNNFNHFPKGTLRDIFLPRSSNDSCPFCNADSSFRGEEYEPGGLFADMRGVKKGDL